MLRGGKTPRSCSAVPSLTDLLKSQATLGRVLQEDELCVVRAIEAVLKTKKALDKLKIVALEEMPFMKKVLA